MSISKKLSGYRSQDKKWNIYSEYHFITAEHVSHMLQSCNYTCYYCQIPVKQEYTVRDPEQWTLDRIDNTMGHNKENVLISCLGCNLKRRNRSVKKFLFTKQLVITKCSDENVQVG
jgi:hypothetical protein